MSELYVTHHVCTDYLDDPDDIDMSDWSDGIPKEYMGAYEEGADPGFPWDLLDDEVGFVMNRNSWELSRMPLSAEEAFRAILTYHNVTPSEDEDKRIRKHFAGYADRDAKLQESLKEQAVEQLQVLLEIMTADEVIQLAKDAVAK